MKVAKQVEAFGIIMFYYFQYDNYIFTCILFLMCSFYLLLQVYAETTLRLYPEVAAQLPQKGSVGPDSSEEHSPNMPLS